MWKLYYDNDTVLFDHQQVKYVLCIYIPTIEANLQAS